TWSPVTERANFTLNACRKACAQDLMLALPTFADPASLQPKKEVRMTQAQLETRKERSENGALIASQTEEGFRVYAVRNPSKVYLVKKDGDQWTCTCSDFEFHKADATWRCKHVLAVAPWPKPEETLPVEVEFDDPTQGLGIPESPAPDQVRRERVRKEAGPGNGQASAIPAAGGENLPNVQEKTLVQEKSGPPKPAAQKRTRRAANG